MSAKKSPAKAVSEHRSFLAAAQIILSLTATKNSGKGAKASLAESKRRNPPKTEIDPVVKALMSAKAGMPARGVDNIGDPQPLGLSRESFLELLGPFNAVIDNYEKSEPMKVSEMKDLYDKKKLVKDVVDAVHGKCQVHP